MEHFTFFLYKFFRILCVCYTQSTFLFRLATSSAQKPHMSRGHILDGASLDFSSFTGIDAKVCYSNHSYNGTPNSFVPVFFCFAYLYNLNFRLIQPPQCQRQLHSYALASPLSCSEALVHTSFLSYPDNNNQNFTTQSCTVFNL